ncbi:hypothetical protein DFH94DRAFT_838924 [Russula ochroleuca]|uniref:Complex 1 LYR protein domain-containing protein n=1 Tax=Russula ochroleuca TaxID=152965 RepID=A0A9P5MW68_9AGAM|nr:hypothetical protein DFH94DRAFT_838924 [Russula ochroleuca]
MSNPPSAKSILQLYASMLRTSKSFSSYNFREYFLRRTKSTFKEMQNEKDPARVAALYNESVKELTALKRGAIVNQLYGGWTLAVEKQKLQRESSNN